MKKIVLSLLAVTAAFFLAAFDSPVVTYKGVPGPVTFGVPFKQGAVKDVSRLNLNGVPMQVKVNAKWQDGSVKWALFDTDLPADFKGKFTVGKAHKGAFLYKNGCCTKEFCQVYHKLTPAHLVN